MKYLQTEFEGKREVKGTHFKQLQKSDKAFLYKLTDIETGSKRYEVFLRKVVKADSAVLGGKLVNYDEHESYPYTEAFGSWAWCISDYNKALRKFNELNKISENYQKIGQN